MTTRAETTAATRQALLQAAGELLQQGGPDQVTLREVGARAGVSRTAAYRHFESKETLLTELATHAWEATGDALQALIDDDTLDGLGRLRGATKGFMAFGRAQPHLYHLMFTMPDSDPTALVRAAERTHDQFVDLVAAVTGQPRSNEYAALLLTGAHGIAGLELSGHLTTEKWGTDGDALLDLLISRLPPAP